jgi:hypothetical protein
MELFDSEDEIHDDKLRYQCSDLVAFDHALSAAVQVLFLSLAWLGHGEV